MTRYGATGLTVAYGPHVAVRALDVGVAAGEVTALVGGDGAGKTSTLRALTGLVRPAAGRVTVPARDRIGVVPADGGEFGDLTVAENLSFAAAAYRVPPGDARPRIDRLLGRMGLDQARGRLAARLSGGMRRKLALAMALLHQPDLLVLDEPTTGLDPVSRIELWRALTEEAAAGRSVLLATTYVDEAARAHRVLVLDGGRVLADASPAAIVRGVRGTVVTADRPLGPHAWRHGRHVRTWMPEGHPGVGDPSATTLEDAVIIASLTADASPQEVSA